MSHCEQNQRPIAVDLFAGVGGMTLGFECAGFDVLASVEFDPIHACAHKFNFSFWSVFCASVAEITGEEIRKASAIGDRDLDVVFGGPPCQGFSLMGKRMLDDPRNSLVFHYIRLVLELKPKFFVIENVKGMTTGQHKQFIEEIFTHFEANNYKIRKDYKVLNAAAYGVPQSRERLFLLGCREDQQLPNYPMAITQPRPLDTSKTTPKQATSYLPLFSIPLSPSVWEALGDLPEVENYPELENTDSLVTDFGEASDYANKLRGICVVNNDYSYPRIYNPKILTSSMRTNHNLESRVRFLATPPGKVEPISRFHKLDPKGVCNTLRAGTATDKGAFTSARPIHPFTPRCITVREAARLHSYPDWFRFHVTKWHGFRQVGNSVPPLLAKAVAAEIIKALKVEPFKPTTPIALGDETLLKFDMTEAAEYFGVSNQVIKPRTRKSKLQKSYKLAEPDLNE